MHTKLTDLFLAQLEREAVMTRRVLERVPEGRNDWKPHPKSMTLGYLAALVAWLPSMIASIIKQDEFDLEPPGGSSNRPQAQLTSRELVQMLDASVAQARAALTGASDEQLMKWWRVLMAGHVVGEQTRHIALSDGVFSHLAHHRGQLTVYLRLNEVSVPAIYGPSADEGH